MQYIRPFLSILFIGFILCSCGRIVCQKETTIHDMKIAGYDTSVKYTVRLVRYEAGNNFVTALDSTENSTKITYSLPIEEGKEYKVVVLPVNRQHTFKDFHFGHEKRKGSPGLQSEQCKTSVEFTMDGQTKTQPFWVEYGGFPLNDIQL